MSVKGKPKLAHRVAYEISVDEIPDGMFVLHKSDNRKCVNPKHLFLGTNADNVKDMIKKGRQAKGERNGRSKLTEEEVIMIRNLYATGDFTYNKLASLFPVCSRSIQSIVKEEYWKLPLAEQVYFSVSS